MNLPKLNSFRTWAICSMVALSIGASTAQAQDSEVAVVGFLGHLNCHEVTDGWGNDDLNVVYGVLVGYTDGSYRTWGDYLYYRRSVGDSFRQGPLTQQPLFVHSFLRTRRPTTKDTKIDHRQVRFVRVAVALVEYDSPAGLAAGTAGRQNITAKLRRFPWSRYAAPLRGAEASSVFGQRVLRAARTSFDDNIGIREVMLTARTLADASRVANLAHPSHLTAFRMPPRNTRHDFRMQGDGSDYRGSIWLTRGVRSIYQDVIARSSRPITIRQDQVTFLLQNRTPFDVQVRFRREGGSGSDRIPTGRRRQYTLRIAPGDVPSVTVAAPEFGGGIEFARFVHAVERLGPLRVVDGWQYQLNYRNNELEWVRQ